MEDIIKGVFIVIIALLVFVVFSLILAIPILFLWNWLIPTIFEGNTINYFQAWGLLVLCGILIKSTSSNSSNK